jgi:hypothetical protein
MPIMWMWVLTDEYDNRIFTFSTTTATMTVIEIIETISSTATTVTTTQYPSDHTFPTNSDGTQIATLTYDHLGQKLTTVL